MSDRPDLEEIERRAERFLNVQSVGVTMRLNAAELLASSDIPALLAYVRELEAELEAKGVALERIADEVDERSSIASSTGWEAEAKDFHQIAQQIRATLTDVSGAGP